MVRGLVSLSLISLIIIELITLPIALMIYAIYSGFFTTIGFYIELSKASIENLSRDYPAIVSVSIDAPPNCDPVSKSIITRLDRDVYISFNLSELAPLRDCWKRYREEVVSRHSGKGSLSTIPAPGFTIVIDAPDFRGGEYYATIFIGPREYLITYYSSIYGLERGYEIATKTLLREPEKILELPQKIIITKDQIRFRYIDKNPAMKLYEEIIKKSRGETITQSTSYQVNCPQPDPSYYSSTYPPISTIKCYVYNDLFWDLSSTPPRPKDPPSEWINRVWKRYDGNPTLYPDPNYAKYVWREIVSRFAVEYHFPKSSGWTRDNVVYYIGGVTYYVTGSFDRYGLVSSSTLTGVLNKMNPYSPSVFYIWNNTLGEPGVVKKKINIPIGMVIINSKLLNKTRVVIELGAYQSGQAREGISFFGKPVLGGKYDVFVSGNVISVDNFPFGEVRELLSRFIMVPTTFNYLGDYIIVDWYISERYDEYIAKPGFTFIPGFNIEQIHVNEIGTYQYPEFDPNLYPSELSEIDWEGTSRVYNSTTLPALTKNITLDENNYRDVSESNPGLVLNLMFSAVTTFLSILFSESAPILSFFLSTIGVFVTFDYYYMNVSVLYVVLRADNAEQTPTPLEWCKETTSMYYTYQRIPLKLYYYISIGTSGSLSCSLTYAILHTPPT